MKQFEYHGISSCLLHMDGTDWLKRDLLLYDKIGLIYLAACKWELRSHSDVKKLRADTYEYLQESGVLYEPEIPIKSNNIDVLNYFNYANSAKEKFEYEHPSDPVKYRERELEGRKPADNSFTHYIDMQAHLSRAVAVEEGQNQGIIATPIIQPSSLMESTPFLKKSFVLQVVLHEFPVPEYLIPFEDILQLRAEEEFISKRNALRAWVRKVASENWTENDIREEVRFLLDQYTEYMRIQKIKYSMTSLSAVAKFAAGAIEDGVKLKFEDLTGRVFSLFGENINLAEAELNAPGREVAYIEGLHSRLAKHNA